MVENTNVKAFSAGDLFSHKDLVGNLMLSAALKKVSAGKYSFFLAQNKVQQKVAHKAIKDQDLMGLVEAEVAVFAFDGTELDSGTVVEFMFAKFLDIPAVCYRTDFRGGSGEEATESGDKVNRWNLMVSYYPRTKVLYMNGMVEYQKVWVAKNGEEGNPTEICEAYCEHIATEIMKGIDEVRASKPLVSEAERTLLKA